MHGAFSMRHSLRRASAVLVLNLVLATAVEAADIRPAQSVAGSPLPGVTIEGTIAPGDFAKLASLVLDARGTAVVWLASPGGNLSEALRLGGLIRQLALEVRAPVDRSRPLVRLRDPENNTCASACFFLYVAGVRRQGSVLGIHKPSLPADEYFSLGLDGSVAAHRRIQEATADYLEHMGVPSRYAAMMMAANSSEMIWLTPEDIARDLTGVAAGYEVWLQGPCRTQVAQPGGAELDCVSPILAEMQEERRQRTREHFRGRD
jgi:hypothetical protein